MNDKEIRKTVVEAIFVDRVAQFCKDRDNIRRIADAHEKNCGVVLDELFDRVSFSVATGTQNSNWPNEEKSILENTYYQKKREFEARFIREYMTDIDGRIFGHWLGPPAAEDALNPDQDQDAKKVLDDVGIDTCLQGIRY